MSSKMKKSTSVIDLLWEVKEGIKHPNRAFVELSDYSTLLLSDKMIDSRFISNVMFSYRHDVGLLHAEEKQIIRQQVIDVMRAVSNTVVGFPQYEKDIEKLFVLNQLKPNSYELPENKNYPHRVITIELRSKDKWVLKMDSWVLGKDGDFHYEPMPSSRTKDFIKNTRFDSPEETYNFYLENTNTTKILTK